MTDQFVVAGIRTQQGTHVRVNGVSLSLFLEYCNHSPTGFEWGYNGSGPAQLAFAILLKYFLLFSDNGYDSDQLAQKVRPLYQKFKEKYIAPIKGDTFQLSKSQIQNFLEENNG